MNCSELKEGQILSCKELLIGGFYTAQDEIYTLKKRIVFRIIVSKMV